MHLNIASLDVELARQRLTKADLAKKLGRPPTTLSSWLLGRHPAPPGLGREIETALGLPPGALRAE
jgi:hypothetical protein